MSDTLDISDSDKKIAGLIVGWLIVAPFVGLLTPAPALFVAAPFLLLFGLMALLYVGESLRGRRSR